MRWFFLIIVPMAVGVVISLTTFDTSGWSVDSLTEFASATPAKSQPSTLTSHKRSVVYANGVVEGAQRDVKMRFESVGRLATINVSAGDHVKAGALLATLHAQTWFVMLPKLGPPAGDQRAGSKHRHVSSSVTRPRPIGSSTERTPSHS